MPGRVTIENIVFMVLYVNDFSPSSKELQTYIPWTIGTRQTLDFCKHCMLEFGFSSRVHDDPTTLNLMAERTRREILLVPTVHFHGSYKILCLRTKLRINQNQIYGLTIPGCVIKCMDKTATQNQSYSWFVFANRVSDEIRDRPHGLTFIAAITGVDIINNGANEIETHE